MAKDLVSLFGCFDDKPSYTKDEITHRIKRWMEKNQNIKSGINKPVSIESGDIIFYNIAGLFHPCVIFKKKDGICYGLIVTSKDREHHFLSKIEKSRIFTDSFFSITVASVTEAFALDNFAGIFDSLAELKTAVKLLKTKYKDILL